MLKALEGVYGAWVNIDGFTVPANEETYAGIRIFELSKQAGVKHFIWSSLDYVFKVRNACILSDKVLTLCSCPTGTRITALTTTTRGTTWSALSRRVCRT